MFSITYNKDRKNFCPWELYRGSQFIGAFTSKHIALQRKELYEVEDESGLKFTGPIIMEQIKLTT
ncbi:hypothetical protein DES36_11937 [Alkalibaculum bacchi]|uniref:Uncharacterized protein n=1 Tax=Alkalibaculum bacchi TaxID=645887 RepID=A0A366HYV8_9FIRM|nr:hypothetical protein [Alkalibaculum bacchi]RBP59312.1 hypothetical protein DES36_11937 [Alkalibaculum bacchi]